MSHNSSLCIEEHPTYPAANKFIYSVNGDKTNFQTLNSYLIVTPPKIPREVLSLPMYTITTNSSWGPFYYDLSEFNSDYLREMLEQLEIKKKEGYTFELKHNQDSLPLDSELFETFSSTINKLSGQNMNVWVQQFISTNKPKQEGS
jgi:hypothetical protein